MTHNPRLDELSAEMPRRRPPYTEATAERHAAEMERIAPLLDRPGARALTAAQAAAAPGTGSVVVWERCRCDVDRDAWRRDRGSRESVPPPECLHDPLNYRKEIEI